GTRGALAECPGGSSGDYSRGYRAIPGWSAARDRCRTRKSSLVGLAAHSGLPGSSYVLGPSGTRGAFGKYPGFSRGESRDTWLARRALGGGLRFRHSGTDGELGRHPGESSRLGVFGDTWHSPREGPKGLSVWLSGYKVY